MLQQKQPSLFLPPSAPALGHLSSEISRGCCAFLLLSGLFPWEIPTPPAMTPCDPVGTQTLCSGSVRGQPPPPSRGGRGRADPVSPLPWEWNAHTGSSSSGRGAAVPAQRMGEGRRLQALRLEFLLTLLSRNKKKKKPLEQFWLPSYKSGQLTSSQGGIIRTSAPLLIKLFPKACHVVLLCIRSCFSLCWGVPVTRMLTVILSPSPQPTRSFLPVPLPLRFSGFCFCFLFNDDFPFV